MTFVKSAADLPAGFGEINGEDHPDSVIARVNYERGWNDAIEAAAGVADQEWDQKPIVAPLTNAAYDEAARTIAEKIRALNVRQSQAKP